MITKTSEAVIHRIKEMTKELPKSIHTLIFQIANRESNTDWNELEAKLIILKAELEEAICTFDTYAHYSTEEANLF